MGEHRDIRNISDTLLLLDLSEIVPAEFIPHIFDITIQKGMVKVGYFDRFIARWTEGHVKYKKLGGLHCVSLT